MHGKQFAWVICVAMSVASMQGQAQNMGERGGQTQEPALDWLSASGGGIPAGAVAYGREADGREQFACRGAIGGGIHLGKIASGFTGCNVGYGGREVTLPNYEVLAHPQRRAAIAAGRMAERSRISAAATERSTVSVTDRTTLSGSAMAAATRDGSTQVQPPIFQPIPPSPPDATTNRGFDDNGEPYVDVRLADGTIKRTQARGVTLIKPDGTTQFIPRGVVYSHAPMPTPPELPDDATSGRAWVERHNSELLDVIRTLVRGDEAEMKKFADAESKATNDDVFAQIMNRTRVATFLAQER